MRMSRWMTIALLAAAACGSPRTRLDTRTFELKGLNGEEAARILTPYVFTDRKDAPGAMSYVNGSLTVRETPDNLDKIARGEVAWVPVVKEFFDPFIARVEEKLRRGLATAAGLVRRFRRDINLLETPTVAGEFTAEVAMDLFDIGQREVAAGVRAIPPRI